MEEPLTGSLLRGLTVVEVTGRYSGRYAATLLEALGADVRGVEPDADAAAPRMADADVLITSGENADTGADPDPARRRRFGLAFSGVQVDVSPYGSTGPCRAWKGDDTTLAAHAGLATYVGEADREPLVPPVQIVSHQAGIAAACAALAAVGHGPRTLEVAEFDVFATTHMIGLYPLAFFSGAIPRRAGRRKPAPYPFTHLPCADGWVCVAFLEGRQWASFVELMGSPEWASDERYRDRRRMGEQYPDEVDSLVIPWLKTKTKAELLALALEQRLPIVPLRTVDEVLASEQLAAREFFRPMEIEGRSVMTPGLPFRFTPSGERRSDWPAREEQEREPRPEGGGPLAGCLVLDLGRVASAPCAAQWLADLGADVIKVESRTHLDSTRKGRPLLAADVDAGDAGQTPDLMPFFLSINRGKRSVVLDLATAAGRSVLDRLVQRADVLIENFGAGGLERFGLGPDHLHSLRPDLVVVRISAVGQTGPDAALPGYAPHSTAAAGLDDLCRYPGGEPVGMIAVNFGDVNTAAFGSLATLAGLAAGAGGTFDVSMLESNAAHLGPTLQARHPGGSEPPVTGAPSPMSRCQGDDEWLAASPRTAEERHALDGLVGAELTRWAAERGSTAAAEALQAAGVPAAPALGAEDLLFADQVQFRDIVVEVPHPVLGVVPVHGVPMAGWSEFMAVRGRAPDLGQHTAEILAEHGLTADEIAELDAAGAFDGPI